MKMTKRQVINGILENKEVAIDNPSVRKLARGLEKLSEIDLKLLAAIVDVKTGDVIRLRP
jgi:hypothetical protein